MKKGRQGRGESRRIVAKMENSPFHLEFLSTFAFVQYDNEPRRHLSLSLSHVVCIDLVSEVKI